MSEIKQLPIIIFLVVSSLCFFSCSTNRLDPDTTYSIHDNVRILKSNFAVENFDTAYSYFLQGKFQLDTTQKIYHNFDQKDIVWINITLPDSLLTTHYFSIWHQYFKSVNIYKVDRTGHSELEPYKMLDRYKSNNFRLPTWKIKNNQPTQIFIKVKNTLSIFSFKFLFLNEFKFQEFTQKDSSFTMMIMTFLLTLLFINFIFYYYQRNNSFVWYGLFILFTIFDLISYKDLGVKYFWNDNSFWIENNRNYIQPFRISFLLLFQLTFYGKQRISKLHQTFFKIALFVNALLLLLHLVFNVNNSFLEFSKTILRIELLFIIIFHIVLAVQSKIPKILAIGFVSPMFLYLIRFLYNPPGTLSINKGLLLDNIQYIATSFELVILSWFIISEIIKKNKIAIRLKQENLELQYSFESKIQLAQTEERKKLLNNVHDSFGGYLAALKMHLSSDKTQNHQFIENMVDAFVVDYRFLLNNLSFPEITPENMTQQLNQYCTRVNQITNNKIICNFSLHRAKLPKSKCEHLYRILAELLTNAIKHSEASRINITLQEVDDHTIILEVIDNGIGFKLNPNRTSFGISSIEKRVEEINGILNIDSKINRGTHISVKLNVS